jgi:hypothetical protein
MMRPWMFWDQAQPCSQPVRNTRRKAWKWDNQLKFLSSGIRRTHSNQGW